jgi:branched-chain amino acid transport system ATP-binding protein
MLELRGVSAGYGIDVVMHQVSLTVAAGEIVTLIGANGAGKSTLAKTVSGLLRARTGEIHFDGTRIDRISTAARLRLGIAHVPEGRQVFAGMTVAENLALGALVGTGPSQLDMVCGLFPILRERMQALAGNFSGGQQQMLAIARGLMSRPRLLILDEPSLGLSPLLVAEIFSLIAGLRARGLSVLLVEQNARAALAIADRGLVIENGRVTLSGAAAALLHSPEIAERYLGVGVATATSDEHSALMAARLRAFAWGDG